jgi:hypothetical protein
MDRGTIIFFAIIGSVVAGLVVYWLLSKIRPTREWAASSNMPVDLDRNQGGIEPMSTWWNANKGALGVFQRVDLTPHRKSLIERVMEKLRAEWTYQLDMESVAFTNPPSIDTRIGDCKAYAIVARQMLQKGLVPLLDRGLFPDGCFTFAVCLLETGLGITSHFVLIVSTNDGEYVISVGDQQAKPWATFPAGAGSWQVLAADGWLHGLK